MSCCYPYFLTPIEFNDCLYIDGGVLNNYPINYFNSDIDRTVEYLILHVIKVKKNRNR